MSARPQPVGALLQLRLPGRADEADDPPFDPEGPGHPRLPGCPSARARCRCPMAGALGAIQLNRRPSSAPGRCLPSASTRAADDTDQRRLDPPLLSPRSPDVAVTEDTRRRRPSIQTPPSHPRTSRLKAGQVAGLPGCRQPEPSAGGPGGAPRQRPAPWHAYEEYGLQYVSPLRERRHLRAASPRLWAIRRWSTSAT